MIINITMVKPMLIISVLFVGTSNQVPLSASAA